MRNLPKYEEWLNESVNEGAIEWLKKMKGKALEFGKAVWDGAKREGKETREVFRLLQLVLKGEKISKSQKEKEASDHSYLSIEKYYIEKEFVRFFHHLLLE